jgi:excisionase family DNA binding protein
MLSRQEVAERLHVSDQTVRRWIKSGKLAAYKPGLEWRIHPSDLEAFLEERSFPKALARLLLSALPSVSLK